MRILIPAFLLLLLVSCASASSTAKGDVDPEVQSLATGQLLWSRCQTCHGVDGRAKTTYGAEHSVPDFTTQSWRDTRPYDELVESITNGCGPETAAGTSAMPSHGELSKEEVRALAVYILSLGEQG